MRGISTNILLSLGCERTVLQDLPAIFVAISPATILSFMSLLELIGLHELSAVIRHSSSKNRDVSSTRMDSLAERNISVEWFEGQ